MSVAIKDITSFADKRIAWSENGEPGDGGRWELLDDGAVLVVQPTPGLDYWCRTFYTPLLVKTDGQAMLTPVAAEAEASLSVAFSLKPAAQFDQAGLMVLVDENTWAKAGIEYVDGVPRLACVVTNDGFSDWSTQPWPQFDGTTVNCQIRLSKLQPGPEQRGALVLEAGQSAGASDSTEVKWMQVRIASLRSDPGVAWRMGVYAQSPVKQSGCEVRFHSLRLGPKVAPVHEAALPEGHGGL